MQVFIDTTNSPTPTDHQVVLDGLRSFNETRGVGTSEPISVLARNRSGDVVGGLIGRIFACWLHIELLWLPEHLRGAGIGVLILSRAEHEARQRGCIGAYLDTFSFQAPAFYERSGYTIFGTIGDQPPGFEHYFFLKRFNDRFHRKDELQQPNQDCANGIT
ncbi:GNAT family N-acetyltransferase [Mesorhizobium sp. M0698]|uniref:GNAT family N-acetyltransferase n=1 Tax=Mesorhizobium sp. M0698 TaxID=2956987 RepID=UPI00333A4183